MIALSVLVCGKIKKGKDVSVNIANISWKVEEGGLKRPV
jgi:hypothetical protein